MNETNFHPEDPVAKPSFESTITDADGTLIAKGSVMRHVTENDRGVVVHITTPDRFGSGGGEQMTTMNTTDSNRAVACIRFVRRLFTRDHVHKWVESCWNKWGVGVEEKCRCGQYRHHFFSDRAGDTISWRSGKHPNRPNWRGKTPNRNME